MNFIKRLTIIAVLVTGFSFIGCAEAQAGWWPHPPTTTSTAALIYDNANLITVAAASRPHSITRSGFAEAGQHIAFTDRRIVL